MRADFTLTKLADGAYVALVTVAHVGSTEAEAAERMRQDLVSLLEDVADCAAVWEADADPSPPVPYDGPAFTEVEESVLSAREEEVISGKVAAKALEDVNALWRCYHAYVASDDGRPALRCYKARGHKDQHAAKCGPNGLYTWT